MTRTDSERMVNLPTKVTLKKLGDVCVRELPLESVLACAGELSALYENDEFSGGADTGMFLKLLKKPETLSILRTLAAASTDKSPEDFVNMGIGDWLKLIKVVKETHNWEELRELFMSLVPTTTPE